MSTPSPEETGETPRGRGRGLALAGLVILFLLPLFLRLRPIDHGQPRNYVPDTHVVRAALGMARDRDPVPPVDRYSSYPNLVPYMLLPLYAGHFALGAARGEWAGPAEYGEAVTAEPATVHLIARLLVAFLGALTPWVVFRTARAAGLGRGAWVAAWLVGTGLLHTHFSVQERPWVPMVLFMALAAWPAVLYSREPRLRWLVLSGLAAGLSFSAHQSGLLALGIPGLAWLLSSVGWRAPELRRRLGHGCACVGGFLALSLVVGHPYLLVHGLTPADSVVGAGAGDISVGGQSHRIGFRWASLQHLTKALVGYDPALVLLGVLGLWPALRSRAARPVVLFAVLWAAYFLPQQNDHVRYLLPLSALLALPAGFAGEAWLARGRLAWAALIVLLAFPLVQDLRLGAVLSRPDARAIAEERLARELPAGARLAIDRYGPEVDLDRAALERLATLRARRGDELGTRERSRLERLAADPDDASGLDALFVRELFSFDERAGTVVVREGLRQDGSPAPDAGAGDPPEAWRSSLREQGVTHLLLVDRAPSEPNACLLRELVEGRPPLLVIDPGDGGTLYEARLPMEMRFPLRALWQVERAGPWMALYELP